MPKIQGRKPPRRKRAVTADIDEDLATLARVLDESRLDNNAKGWFIPPWHDGWNAVRLAYEQAAFMLSREDPQIRTIGRWINYKDRSTETYWLIGEMLSNGTLSKRRPLYASLRCYQVLIANSHGGGHVYNDILRPIFDDIAITQQLADLVEYHRRNDAVGVGADERYKNAFHIAWQRGLYLAAYSICPPTN